MKTLFDVGTNVKLVREEWSDNKALCAYCQTASLLSIASAMLALPEAARAWRIAGPEVVPGPVTPSASANQH